MRNAVPRLIVRSTRQVLGLIEIHEAADKQIQPPVIVVIEPDSARRPSWSGDPGLLGNVCKGAVPVVVIQNALAVLRHIEIGKTVTVVIANRHSLPITSSRHPSFFGDVAERAIAIVAVKSIADGLCRSKEVALSAVNKINIHPAVIVVVEKSATRSRSFG